MVQEHMRRMPQEETSSVGLHDPGMSYTTLYYTVYTILHCIYYTTMYTLYYIIIHYYHHHLLTTTVLYCYCNMQRHAKKKLLNAHFYRTSGLWERVPYYPYAICLEVSVCVSP